MKPNEKITTDTSDIWIDSEGILHLAIRTGMKVNEEEVRKVYAAIKEISGGKKVLELMDGSNFYTFNEEAQKYAAKHAKDLLIASAIVINSMGMRVLFNFFNSFFKQPVPFKMFSTEKEALKWLRKFKEQ